LANVDTCLEQALKNANLDRLKIEQAIDAFLVANEGIQDKGSAFAISKLFAELLKTNEQIIKIANVLKLKDQKAEKKELNENDMQYILDAIAAEI